MPLVHPASKQRTKQVHQRYSGTFEPTPLSFINLLIRNVF